MGLLDELKSLGANIDEGLSRFMNNAPLYEKMLKRLPASIKELEVIKYLESGDMDTALANAHNLKGVMGNLSLTPLYNAYTDAVAFIRAGDPVSAKAALEKVLTIQEKIIECIDNAQKQ